MLLNPQLFRDLGGLARDPRAFWRSHRGNVELWANLFVIGWAIAFMLWKGVGFAITVGTVFAIWAMLSVSLNLVVGFTGLLSVGHIGFFGIGAYSMAILSSDPAYEQLRTEAIPTFAWPFFAAPSRQRSPGRSGGHRGGHRIQPPSGTTYTSSSRSALPSSPSTSF